MLTRKTAEHITLLYVIFTFSFSACNANCINKTVDYNEIFKGPLKDTIPNIPLERYGTKYYYFGTVFEGNYFQAIQYCSFHGMSLVSVENAEENLFLFEKLKNFLGVGEYRFWTSGTTLPDNHWVWLSTGKPIIYANWLPNQPDNSGNNEKCLEIRYGHTNKAMTWNDHVCTIAKHVICETIQANCISS